MVPIVPYPGIDSLSLIEPSSSADLTWFYPDCGDTLGLDRRRFFGLDLPQMAVYRAWFIISSSVGGLGVVIYGALGLWLRYFDKAARLRYKFRIK